MNAQQSSGLPARVREVWQRNSDLLRNAGSVVTRSMLLEHVWDIHFDPQTSVVESHMSRLRAKLSGGTATEYIRTIRGSGYLFLVRPATSQ